MTRIRKSKQSRKATYKSSSEYLKRSSKLIVRTLAIVVIMLVIGLVIYVTISKQAEKNKFLEYKSQINQVSVLLAKLSPNTQISESETCKYGSQYVGNLPWSCTVEATGATGVLSSEDSENFINKSIDIFKSHSQGFVYIGDKIQGDNTQAFAYAKNTKTICSLILTGDQNDHVGPSFVHIKLTCTDSASKAWYEPVGSYPLNSPGSNEWKSL